MKRFLLFRVEQFYPAGGWDDFLNSFDSLEAAINGWARAGSVSAHVVDTQSERIVWRSEGE